MAQILIIDSNPMALNDAIVGAGSLGLGDGYARAVHACDGSAATVICAPYDGDPAPSLDGMDGVIFTGSNVAWDTQDSRAEPLAQIMRDVFAAGLPVIGSCNGMQLAATVLGGFCAASPNGVEEGLARDIALSEAGCAHPMMAGRAAPYSATCVHRDEVTRLPEGAVVLASNAHTHVQAFAYEQNGIRFWGTQYHPEYALGDVAAILRMGAGWSAEQCNALDAEALNTDLFERARLTELRNWMAQL